MKDQSDLSRQPETKDDGIQHPTQLERLLNKGNRFSPFQKRILLIGLVLMVIFGIFPGLLPLT